MHSAVLSLLVALVATIFLLRMTGRDAAQAQAAPVSGLAAMVGLCAGWLSLGPLSADAPMQMGAGMLLAALPSVALPVFVAGLVVDFWRPLALWWRVAVSFCMALAGMALTLQPYMVTPSLPVMAALLAVVLFICTVTHAMVVVDKRNGAAAMCVLLVQASVAYVAYEVGDRALMSAAVVVVGAVLGLSFFSFQANLACLGRSGCALLGFVSAALCALLVLRNPTVSWLVPVLLCSHPVLEAAWAWRRWRRGAPAQEGPSLVYLQLVRWATGNPPDRRQTALDNGVAPHLWMLCIVGIAPAALWWQDGIALGLAILLRVAVQVAVAKLLAGGPAASLPAAKPTP